MASQSLTINIKYINQVKETLENDPDQVKLVSDLKGKIQDLLSIPIEQQRLIFAGKLMKDPEELSTHSLFNGCTLHLVRTTPKTEASASTEQQQQQPTQVPPPTGQSFQFPNPTGQPFPQFPSGQPSQQAVQQQMLQNPEILRGALQMMQANPQLFQAMMRSNPAFASMPPETQAMFSNPEFMRLMLNPEVIEAMMQSNPQGMACGMAGGIPPMPTFPIGQPQQQQQQQSQVPPVERFATELQQLRQMGFFDENLNLQALPLANGNVNAAVEWLLSRPF